MALGAEIPDDVETPEDRERAAALEGRIGNAFPNLLAFARTNTCSAELETLLKLTEWQSDISTVPDKFPESDFFWMTGSVGDTPESSLNSSSVETEPSEPPTTTAESTTPQDAWPSSLPPRNILHLLFVCPSLVHLLSSF